MQAVVSTQPWGSEKEPKVQVSINVQSPILFCVYIGAAYLCIGNQGMNPPLSYTKLTIPTFYRKVQVLNFTEPQELTIEGQTLMALMLYS